MGEVFRVSYGKVECSIPYIDKEDGSTYYSHDEWYAVSFCSEYGVEYTHVHTFTVCEDGEFGAKNLASRVEQFLNANGLDMLDMICWNTRTIYGSLAYQDEEYGITSREKEDR